MTRPSERELATDIETLAGESKQSEPVPIVAHLDSDTDELYANDDLTGDPLDDDTAAQVLMVIEPAQDSDDGGSDA
jgi:hypothetical protein